MTLYDGLDFTSKGRFYKLKNLFEYYWQFHAYAIIGYSMNVGSEQEFYGQTSTIRKATDSHLFSHQFIKYIGSELSCLVAHYLMLTKLNMFEHLLVISNFTDISSRCLADQCRTHHHELCGRMSHS